MKPLVISISGGSGVGKTTMAKVFARILGEDKCLVVSGDDLHKYERRDSIWNELTHLDVSANNLDLGDYYLKWLCSNQMIYRSVYNHTYGTFDPPKLMKPKPFIINEGLHALYSDDSRQLSDIKIYVDVEYDLMTHWKLIRDRKERGYTKSEVMSTIEKRKSDFEKYIEPQKDHADVVVTFSLNSPIKEIGNSEEDVDLKISHSINREIKHKTIFENMFRGLEEYTSKLNEFVRCCKEVGKDVEFVQGKGGNISSKFEDSTMIIKASGSLLKEVYHSNGFAMIDYEIISNRYALSEKMTEAEMCELIDESTHTGYKNPSMETAFHAILDGDVIHTHPLYLMVILCSKECENLLFHLMLGELIDAVLIDYCTPGNELAEEIINKKIDQAQVYFLKNHGLIVCNTDLQKGLMITERLNNKAKELLNLPDYEEKTRFKDFKSYLFPDDVLFSKTSNGFDIEMASTHNYIIEGIKQNKLTPDFLTEEQCQSIKNSILEKKRINKK